MTQQPRVFLSYARADLTMVQPVYERLLAGGFPPWMDKKNILGGEQWETSIEKALRASQFVVVCLTRRSVGKRGYLQKEITLALDLLDRQLPTDIYIIPVKLEPCDLPERLARLQCIDLFESDGWARLFQSLRVGVSRRLYSVDGTRHVSRKLATRPLAIPFPISFQGYGLKFATDLNPQTLSDISEIAHRVACDYHKTTSAQPAGTAPVAVPSMTSWAVDVALRTARLPVIPFRRLPESPYASWLVSDPEPAIVIDRNAIQEAAGASGLHEDVVTARAILHQVGHFFLHSQLLLTDKRRATFAPAALVREDAEAWVFAFLLLSFYVATHCSLQRSSGGFDDTVGLYV